MDRRREVAAGDQPIDGRAAEAGGLHDRGQPCEQAYRLSKARRKQGGAVLAGTENGFATTLGDAGRRTGDDSVPGIIDIMYFIAVD
jgi:hypothetical protein